MAKRYKYWYQIAKDRAVGITEDDKLVSHVELSSVFKRTGVYRLGADLDKNPSFYDVVNTALHHANFFLHEQRIKFYAERRSKRRD